MVPRAETSALARAADAVVDTPTAAGLVLEAVREMDSRPQRTQAERARDLADQELWMAAREMIECPGLKAKITLGQCDKLQNMSDDVSFDLGMGWKPSRPPQCAACARAKEEGILKPAIAQKRPQDRAEAPEADTDSPGGQNVQPDPEPSAAAGCSVPEPEVETRLIHAADHLGPKEEPQPANPDPFAGLDFKPFDSRKGGEKLPDPAVSVTHNGDLTFNVPATKALDKSRFKRVRLYVSACPSGNLAVGIKGVGSDEGEDGTYALSHTGGSSTGRRIACRAFSLQHNVQFSQLGAPLIWSKAQGGMWCAELKRKEA